jgi:uncharacterized membrane protein HdeD (DUF308 family)
MTASTSSEPLATLAKGVWWLVLIRGILAIGFGVIALVAPGAALTAIAIVFGAFALVDGITTVVHGIRARGSHPRWGWLIAEGVLTALAGLAALILPGVVGTFGGLVVLWTIAFWSIASGIMALRSAAGAMSGRGKTWGIVSGILGLVFGVILVVAILLTPGATLLSLIWTVGIYAILSGIALIVTAIYVRAAVGKAPDAAAAAKKSMTA